MKFNSESQQKEEVELAYALLQSSIESLKDILIFSIDRNYRYLNFNRAFKDATAHAYGTMVERGLSMLDSISDQQEKTKAKLNCDRALQGESHTTIESYGVLNPSYFETRYSPLTNEANEVIGVTILSTNVTERKLAEEQIKALNKELEAFSYSIAHDLRAPLRVIAGYSGILIEDHSANLDEECQRLLKIISGNVSRMNNLIEDLLHFSKLGKAPLHVTSINTRNLIETILHEQLYALEIVNVEIKLGVLENLKGDWNLLYHVFSNLISNAIKYSRKKDKPLIEIDSWKQGDVITYSVKDNGVGFDKMLAYKMFEVFQRLHKDAEFEGTGIGLAIAQRIVTRHGGKIWADAEVGHGAIFYFSLPA